MRSKPFITQNQVNLLTLMTLVIALLSFLGGCAPYWQQNPAWATYEPVRIEIAQFADPSPACGHPAHSVIGCAVRTRDSAPPNTCRIFVSDAVSLPLRRCVTLHEARHCIEGEDHPEDRPTYAVDCGNGEMVR